MRLIGKLIAAVFFGIITGLALSPVGMAFDDPADPGRTGAIAMGAGFVACLVLVMFAPTVRRGFGRGFLIAGVAFLLLPLSSMLFTGSVVAEITSAADEADQAMAMVGSGLAAGLVTGLASFVGLLFGAIFIIAGLVLALGGRREVIVVQR